MAFAIVLGTPSVWLAAQATNKVGWPGGRDDRILVNAIAVDPFNADIVYAAIHSYAVGTQIDGIFKSVNGGRNWNSLDAASRNIIGALFVDPGNHDVLYALDKGINNGNLLRSVDGGVNWKVINSGIFGLTLDGTTKPATVYGWNRDVFKSADEGETWITIGSQVGIAGSLCCIAIDVTKPSTVYIAVNSDVSSRAIFATILKGVNGGNWTPIHQNFPRFISTLAVDPLRSGNIYAGASGGFFKSIDSGRTFVFIKSLPEANVGSLAIDRINPGTMYAALSVGLGLRGAGGVFKSSNRGETWVPSESGLPTDISVTSLAVAPSNNSTIYLASQSGIFKSTDAGKSWQATGSK